MATTITVHVVRHAAANSNVPDNSGVHLHDPPLMPVETANKYPELRGKGRDFPSREIQSRIIEHEEKFGPSRLFIVSALRRAMETMILGTPLKILLRVHIWVEPYMIEQTSWISDRPSPRPTFIDNFKATLKEKLQIDYTDCNKAEELVQLMREHGGEEFDKNMAAQLQTGVVPDSLVEMLYDTLDVDTSSLENMSDDFRYKSGDWHPERVIKRGHRCIFAIASKVHEVLGERELPLVIHLWGHGGFINYMTKDVGDVRPKGHVPKLTDWATGESRTYLLTYQLVGDRLVDFPELMTELNRDERLKSQGKKTTVSDQALEDRRREQLQDHVGGPMHQANMEDDRYTDHPDHPNHKSRQA
ncbi:hypothetical protein F4780DRAFT_788721 [Xylariomycetidae sp. FL0641]|nr:hypothetical protein F4780DRAFT_788721 [Xylariomycetidae sp. FL0641]